jgi:hypothetical protein
MTTLSRRETLLAPVALAATSTVTTAASEKKMTLAMHQNGGLSQIAGGLGACGNQGHRNHEYPA